MANEYLGLSLFVMLLSFFIILTSMSDYEDSKAKPIMSSLNMAFSAGALDKDEPAPSIKMSETQDFHEGTTLDKIEGLFNAHIKTFKITKNRLGTEMSVTMTRDEFEKALESTGEVLFLEDPSTDELAEAPFLDTLTSLIATSETEVQYRMDIMLGTGENPAMMQNEKPASLREISDISTGYARMLEAAGMPVKFISTGIGAGEKDMVVLMFRRYVPVNVHKAAGGL